MTEKYKFIFYYYKLLDMNGALKVTTVPAWEFYDNGKAPLGLYNVIHNANYQKIIKRLNKKLRRGGRQ